MGGPNIIGMIGPLIAPPRPEVSTTPKPPVAIVLGVETVIIDDPVVDLLKQLLPVDSPVGTVLERFREAVASLQNQQPANDAAAKLMTLLKALPIDLKTVTGEGLRSVIDRLGLRYEPMLQSAFSEQTPVPLPQLTAQNLKAALLTLLDGFQSGTPVDITLSAIQRGIGHAAGSTTAPPLSHPIMRSSGENLESALLKQLEAQSRGILTTSSESDALQQPNTTSLNGQLQPAARPAPQGNVLQQLPQTANPVVGQEATAAAAKLIQSIPQATTVGSIAEGPVAALRAIDAGNEVERLAAPKVVGAESEVESLISNSKNIELKTPQLGEQITKSAVNKLLLGAELPVQNADSAAQSIGLSGKQATDVRQQAHELLTVIERTQVLNSVNSERGEPLTFQIPFVLDGRSSTAEFYVDRRSEEGTNSPPEERHYSVVALLDLSELGALRVDLALHKKQLSVKVTVEREDTVALASKLLPELAQTLATHGFTVEFLRCELKTDGSVRGEELRDQPLPEGDGLINIRA
jgi:hypothetical protein